MSIYKYIILMNKTIVVWKYNVQHHPHVDNIGYHGKHLIHLTVSTVDLTNVIMELVYERKNDQIITCTIFGTILLSESCLMIWLNVC